MADFNWTLALPQPARFTLRRRAPSFAYQSQLSGAVQTVSLPGAQWGALLEFPPMRAADSVALEVLLMQLRGRANRLVLWHLARPALRGAGGGTPIVNGGGQTGSAISISGLPNNRTGWALPGDMVGIGGELKMVTASCNSDGSGIATLTFEPPLRSAKSNGTAIVTAAPTTKFMLASDSSEWTHEPVKMVRGHVLELIEAFA